MAKTRAQRKAERRAREAELERQGKGGGKSRPDGAAAQRDRAEEAAEGRAQQDTQLGVSGEVAEAEAAIETGTSPDDLEAPAPSRADTPPTPPTDAPAPTAEPQPATETAPAKPSRRERRRAKREEEQRKKEAQAHREAAKKEPTEERRRGAVTGFIASCWAELKRVQWPDRDTLVQASAVTVVFVAIAAAYLGALDALFNLLVKRII
jgi:preprotein translocase SecE subunit